MLSKRVSTMLLAGAAAAALTSAAQAMFVFDIRATGATGAGNVVVNTKSVTVVSPGTVTFDLYGLITTPYKDGSAEDGNPLNEANKSMGGSFTTVGTSVKGNLAATVNTPFQGLSSSNGTIVDLDGDGDLDVGSLSTTSGADYWSARAVDTANGVPGQAALLGTMTLTITSANALQGATLVMFTKKGGAPTGVGQWTENGAFVQSNASNVSSGTPVSLGLAPEPTSIGLIGLAGLGMFARRRK